MKTRGSAAAAPPAEDLERDLADYKRRFRLLAGRLEVLEGERQKLSAVMHHTDAGFLVFDASLRVVWTNRVFVSRFRRASGAGDVLGLSCHGAVCAQAAPCGECPSATSLQSGRVAHKELHFETDGRSRHIYATAVPIRSMTGAFDQTIVMLQDVSDLNVLRQSEARKSAILDTALDAILTLGEGGRVLEFNRAAETLFGYSRDEVMGRELTGLVLPPSSGRGLGQELKHCLESGGSGIAGRRVEATARRKDGTEFPAEMAVTLTPLGGAPLLTCYIRDLSERVAADEALRRSEEQLRLAQKMEAVGRLAGGVAHDFNNLLTVIVGRCDMLRARFLKDGAPQKAVETIRQAADRATALTRQLVAFGRRQVLEPRVLDLNGVVTGLAAMLRSVTGETIEFHTGLRPDLGRVKADPGQIEQVIMNLVVNSRDAMPEGGRLTIETTNVDLDESYARQHVPARAGRYVMLAVSDTGCGMDKEAQARIFEPFFTTKERGKGSGLGLATVYGIVKQSGGYIWVYSEPGRGSTFKIYLPRVDDPVAAEAPPRPAPVAAGGSETVLLVEDEDGVRSLAREILESYGYTILDASHGAEALRICETFRGEIHLLLTDVVMPRMSGRELADRITGLRRGIRVLYTSGYTDNVMVHHGVPDAEVAFLQKPFTPSTLARKVRQVLDGTAGGAEGPGHRDG